MTDRVYSPIIESLEKLSIHTYFLRPDQLVVSRQDGPANPLFGNSFWISNRSGRWYVCTWAPRCYGVPADADLVQLVREFVDTGSEAQWRIPGTLIARYRLRELTESEFERLFGG